MHPSKPLALCNYLADRPFKTVFFLALIVRCVNLVLLQGRDAFFAETDTLTYWALGAALAKADTFWPTFLSMTDRMPLYPLLLAGVQATVGDAPRAVAFIQAVIDSGTCAIIAALGAMVSPRVGFVAGIIAALSTTLIIFSTQILTDTLFLFFFATMLLAGARFLIAPTNSLAFLAGIAGGLSLATRPAVVLLLAAAIPLVFAGTLVKKRLVASALAASLLFAVGAAGPIMPVLLRNAIHYQSWSLTAQTGDYLAFWIVPLVQQRFDGTPYQTTVDRVEALYQQRLTELGLSAENNPFRRAALKSEVAREQMERIPYAAYVKAWLEGMVVNLGAPALLADPRVRALPKPSFYNTPGTTLWEKARNYIFDDPGLYQILLVIGLLARVPILALQTFGFFILVRKLPWAAVFAFGICFYFLLLNGPIASAKYRLPFEPVLIVLASIPLTRFVERRQSGKTVTS